MGRSRAEQGRDENLTLGEIFVLLAVGGRPQPDVLMQEWDFGEVVLDEAMKEDGIQKQ